MIKKYNYFIILPDDNFKRKWDLFITSILFFTAFVTPYRNAFVDYDNLGWITVNLFLDAGFFVDIVLNFYMAYYDDTDDIVDDRKKIAKRYLRSWFLLDMVSVLPISEAMQTSNYS